MDCEVQDDEGAVNPCPPEWIDNDATVLLRGDAIGDTAYTHRWVLKCLFTITEALPKYLKDVEPLKPTNQNLENKSSTAEAEDKSYADNAQSKINVVKKVENIIVGEEHPKSGVKTDDYEDKNIACHDVLELDSQTEDAACQLWDMTVEKDVTCHLLSLQEVDILQLAALIFQQSCAPRLTEVMVGVVANLFCQEEACAKVLKGRDHNEILQSTLQLLGGTNDVPTLCEVLRLMRLLLWYRINRTPNSTWASCPLIKLLCQECGRNSIIFLINNSLSDTLISSLLELLSNFLFVCLPETGVNVASLFSVPELIDGLIDILQRKSNVLERSRDEEQENILHLNIICLYAFIDTPGARLVQNVAKNASSKLELNLLHYIEHESCIEDPEQLAGDPSDRICRVLCLFQLIIPHMKLPSLLFTVGRLLALIHGQTHQYSANVRRSTSREELDIRSSIENLAFFHTLESTINEKPTKKKSKRISGKRHASDSALELRSIHSTYGRQFSNPSIDECGWLSPPSLPTNSSTEIKAATPDMVASPEISASSIEERGTKVSRIPLPSTDEEPSSTFLINLKELEDHLEDYCHQLLAWWWSAAEENKVNRLTAQRDILDVLDQCHAHEVLFILKAVRRKDCSLVPRLQEQLLDSGTHRRLVALLAYMYQ